MEHLPGGHTLNIPNGCFPLSTDSMVLSHFVRLGRRSRVLDLGAGCGSLGLLLCAKDPGCVVTGLELDPTAHEAALNNILRNQLTARMNSICGDLRTASRIFSPGSFDCCLSNPPYFSGGPAGSATPLARREDTCTIRDLMSAAAWTLKYGGDFFLVHRPERLAELIARGTEAGLECKRLCLVRHREGSPVNLILLQLRKGGKPGLIWEEIILHHADGSPTAVCREIYHIKEA